MKSLDWVEGCSDSYAPRVYQINTFETSSDYECRRVGLSAMYGLRHAYAHRRYHDLARYDAPVLGGQAPRDLYKYARAVITEGLGHGRLEIVASYVGRVSAESD